jgi:guanosine-3',5'-bis(diphosphate) 3'-pyrophosphohydrolase
LGVAAHWKYKSGGNGRMTDGRQYRWLRELLDILEHASNPDEFLEHTKLEMFQDQVFCFTPKGDLISLPSGATPVDFAYAVHSDVGDTCVGAKINGRIMPLRSRLHNGDQVEIITSKAQTPNPTWERFVVSGKARARIRRFVRTQQRAQYADLGRAILVRAFRQEGYDLTEKALDGVLKIFKAPTTEDLVAMVGEGTVTAKEVVSSVYPELKTTPKPDNVVPLGRKGKPGGDRKDRANAVPIRGLIPGMAVHFAGCCHPLPGDRIVGIVTTGKGVTVHTIDCENLEQYAETPERWLDISWDETEGAAHIGRIDLVVNNEPGTLSTVTTVIAKNMGNITNLKITNRTTEFFEMLIDIEVRDVKHLTNVIAALRATPSINSVERARN